MTRIKFFNSEHKIFFPSNNAHVDNLLGVLGAYISYIFINDGFGVASFLFCTFFFVFGVNLLFGKKIFNIARNLRYLIAGLNSIKRYILLSFSEAASFHGAAQQVN